MPRILFVVNNPDRWPLNLPEHYDYDTAALRAYAEAAQTQLGFQAWLEQHVLTSKAAA